MTEDKLLDVIIVGGSYAGLAAAMTLGRSLRNVLIIDSGKPCNRQTPHAHNFITQDGEEPQRIAEIARKQVLQYKTVAFTSGVATGGRRIGNQFDVRLDDGRSFRAQKVLFATGVSDQMPALPGFAACWGISVLHCPYCHGYEVSGQPIGILGNGDTGFELSRLISNWSDQLTLFTNGRSTLTPEQQQRIEAHGIAIVEDQLVLLNHTNGYLQSVRFQDGGQRNVSALFARVGFRQHCTIPEELGCALTEHGYLQVNDFGATTISGVFAAGDNTTMFRAISAAVASGMKAGATLNKELIDEIF